MKMHYCTCRINLSGQGCHIVEIYPTDPMSWPEVQYMMQLHTDENVFDIKPVAIVETTVTQEKQRLLAKYRNNPALVERTFPGRSPHMELLMPGEADNQPTADEFGIVIKQPDNVLPDDDDEPLVPGGREPPTAMPVFKPGRHARPFPPENPPGA